MVLKPMSEEEKQARTRDADLRSRFVEMRRAAEDDLRRRQEDLSKAHAEREAAMRRQAEEEARKKRSEEHTSELQSLMRISYAVFCLKKKKNNNRENETVEPDYKDTCVDT